VKSIKKLIYYVKKHENFLKYILCVEGTCASHGTTFLTGILCALLFKHHIAVKSKTGAEEKNADSQSIVTFQG
jgi:hypothetical protein